MIDFSIQETALTGFGVVREHRRCIAVWASFALLGAVMLRVASVALAGPAVMAVQSIGDPGGLDPAMAISVLRKLLPLYVLLVPASLVFYGVILAAMNRAVLRPSEKKVAYLAFGADEFRQMGVLLLGVTCTVVVYVTSLIGCSIVIGPLASYWNGSAVASGLLAVVLSLVVTMWFVVRLSLASALTFETGRVTLFGSWALTKGRSWSILATYALVFPLAAVILLLAWLVIAAVVALATGGDLQAALATSDTSFRAPFFTVAHVLKLALGAGLSALIWPVLLTPPAAILRQMRFARGHDVVRKST